MQLELNPMEYQQEALFDFTTPIVGVSGGKRSGKSRMITCLKSIILSSMHPGKPGVVASPVYGMTRRNLLPIYRELAEQLGIVIEGLDVKSPDCLKVRWGDKVSTIWLDCTIENYGRMNGLSLAWGFADELDKARPEDAAAFVEELIIRCSNPYGGQIAQINLTGAPELNGFMAEFFVEQASANKKLYKWSMMDNEMLSDEYKQRILDTIPENRRAGWVEGEFMYNTDGLVYDSYDPNLNHTNLTIADIRPSDVVDVSWDINDGGTSCYISVKRGQHEFFIQEWVKMKDTEAVIERVKKMPWVHQAVLSCDPACTQVFTYIHKSGLKHAIMKSAPEIAHRVTAVNNRMGTQSMYEGVMTRHWLINTRTCPVLNKCLMRQGYINGVPDKKTWIEAAGTDISGPIDAVGYKTFRHFPYSPRGPVAPITLRGF